MPYIRFFRATCATALLFWHAAVFAAAGVATPHPLATQAALRALKDGGSAADAGVAAALTLAVVDPAHSGLGGGGLALYADKARNQNAFFDYLEAAPLAEIEGAALPSFEAVPKSPDDPIFAAAVPGFIAGLEKLHRRFGKLAWAELFYEAISTAEEGFVPGEAYFSELERVADAHAAASFKTFFASVPRDKKSVLKQENLAHTLKKLRDGGAKEFYEGTLSKALLKEFAEAGSRANVNDFLYYEARVLPAAVWYDKDVKVLAPGIPSFGGLFLDRLERAARVSKPELGSPAFINFLEDEAKRFVAGEMALNGTAGLKHGYAAHVSIIDAQGNALSMTNTLHGLFGSGIVLPGTGILLGCAGRNGFVGKAMGDKAATFDWSLKKRPVTWLTPLIISRGFTETTALGTSGGIAIPQILFQLLEKSINEKLQLIKLVQEPLFYTLPQEKQNLYDKSYPANALAAKTAFPATLTPYPVGSLQLVQSVNGKLKAFSANPDGAKVVK